MIQHVVGEPRLCQNLPVPIGGPQASGKQLATRIAKWEEATRVTSYQES
jgi:hypothetical protein